jgi:hypothetical protein
MRRSFTRRCLLTVVVCTGTAWSTSDAAAQLLPSLAPLQTASAVGAAATGDLHGMVRDERGEPLGGAVISALGGTSVFAVSDQAGRFALRALPVGPYLVRVHLRGYQPARGRVVQVSRGTKNTSNLVLTRLAGADGTPPVLAAGVGTTGTADAPVTDAPADEAHGHDEVAWRLRHLKRSVLKDAEAIIAGLDDDSSVTGDAFDSLGRAVGVPVRIASAFAELPLNGQINFLTTTSFDRPQDLFLDARAPRPIAYLALTAPFGAGIWTMRGTMTQGDLASWTAAGSYTHRAPGPHQYEAGLSYSTQQYLGGNTDALAAVRDGNRNVGVLYAFDTWSLSPRLSLNYGAKYARYDYLDDQALVSPRAGVTFRPFPADRLRVRAAVSRRETAPGAEEFIPPSVGMWLPPERTFSPLVPGMFRPQRLDHYEVAAERDWDNGVVVGVRVFRQRVDDQMVTLFGVAPDDGPARIGHYHVASAGDFDAQGWGVSVSRTMFDGVRASLDYMQTDAEWLDAGPDTDALSRVARSVVRTAERMHDLTASIESVVAPTATRIYALYKVNNAFAGATGTAGHPGVRFDVQVNQALPFLRMMSAEWEMLVAVSNVFREDLVDSSVYDEVLVVRPPKRVLGGVTVRF